MMGFAVIPIIFTIAEDTAMSNVPIYLQGAALALGAVVGKPLGALFYQLLQPGYLLQS